MEIFEKGIIPLQSKPILTLFENIGSSWYGIAGKDITLHGEIKPDAVIVSQLGVFLLFMPDIQSVSMQENGTLLFNVNTEHGLADTRDLIAVNKRHENELNSWFLSQLPDELIALDNKSTAFLIHSIVVLDNPDKISAGDLILKDIPYFSQEKPSAALFDELSENFFNAFPTEQGKRELDRKEMNLIFYLLYEGNKGLIRTFDILVKKINQNKSTPGEDKEVIEELKSQNRELHEYISKMQREEETVETSPGSPEKLKKELKQKMIQIGSLQNQLVKLANEEEKNKELKMLVSQLEEHNEKLGEQLDDYFYASSSLKKYRFVTLIAAVSAIILGTLIIVYNPFKDNDSTPAPDNVHFGLYLSLGKLCNEMDSFSADTRSRIAGLIGFPETGELQCSILFNYPIEKTALLDSYTNVLIESLIYQGDAFINENDPDKALENFNRAIQYIGKTDADSRLINHLELGFISAYLMKGESNAALDIINTLINQSSRYFFPGDYEKLESMTDLVVSQDDEF